MVKTYTPHSMRKRIYFYNSHFICFKIKKKMEAKVISVRILFIFIIVLFLMPSCNKNNSILYDNSFNELFLLAEEENKPFCLVLVDSMQDQSKKYLLSLKSEYKHLTKKAVYGIVNVEKQDSGWYMKWLCPLSLPLTCVFSPKAQLIDLIPGSAKESFLYIEKTIKNKSTSEFHWPNHFGMPKHKIMPLLNDLLSCQNSILKGVPVTEELNSINDSLKYPYILHLKILNSLLENDTLTAKRIAKTLLEIESPYYLEFYKSEFIGAKTLLDSDFNIMNEPRIRVDSQEINLDGCTVGKKMPIELTIFNDGNKPLCISQIITSCTCLKSLNENDTVMVDPLTSTVLLFDFIPDVKGELFREIFIASNAINTPILNIDIVARSSNIK